MGLRLEQKDDTREKTSDAPSSELPLEYFALKERIDPGGSGDATRLFYHNTNKLWTATTLEETLYDPHSVNFGLANEIFTARFMGSAGRYELVGSRGLIRPGKADAFIDADAIDGTVSVYVGDPLADSGQDLANVHNSWLTRSIPSGSELWVQYLPSATAWHVMHAAGSIFWRFTLNEDMGATTANEGAADLLELDGTDTTEDVTILDPLDIFGDLNNGDAGFAFQAGGSYYAIQAPCP